MRAVSPDLEGNVYQVTRGNSLSPAPPIPINDPNPVGNASQWLINTPDCWGEPSCGWPNPGAAQFGRARWLDAMRDHVASAEETVDVTGMLPFPNGSMKTAFIDGLAETLGKGNSPTVRVLFGAPPFQGGASDFLNDVLEGVGPLKGNLKIAVGDYDSDFPVSWNHSKMVLVDGERAVVGGTNWWGTDYVNTSTPVHDVTMRLSGPATQSAHNFTDVLWNHFCDEFGPLAVHYQLARHGIGSCPSPNGNPENPPAGTGDVTVLGMGRLGLGMNLEDKVPPLPPIPPTSAILPKRQPDNETYPCLRPFTDYTNDSATYTANNPSETGLRALVASAEERLFISQQDLLGPCPMPAMDVRLFERLGQALARGVKVTIVTSNPASKVQGGAYNNEWSLQQLATALVNSTALQTQDVAAARTVVCNNLQLGTVRWSSAAVWPPTAAPPPQDNNKPANHAKVVFADDAAFYIGSENLYPSWLQQYGYLIENPTAAADFKTFYTDPLWSYSSPTAIVDYATGKCDLPASEPEDTPPLSVLEDQALVLTAHDDADTLHDDRVIATVPVRLPVAPPVHGSTNRPRFRTSVTLLDPDSGQRLGTGKQAGSLSAFDNGRSQEISVVMPRATTGKLDSRTVDVQASVKLRGAPGVTKTTIRDVPLAGLTKAETQLRSGLLVR